MLIHRYESLQDFLNTAATARPWHAAENLSWYGGVTYNQALKMAANGDETLVSEAEALLDKLTDLDSGETINAWDNSPFGAYPVVPEYLAGMPTCMRASVPSDSCKPINIYITPVCGGMVSTAQVLKRGIAVLALVLKLSRVRPVSLTIVTDSEDTKNGGAFIQLIPMGTTPMSLAHIAHALTHPSFFRHLVFSVANNRVGFTGKFCSMLKDNVSNMPVFVEWMRKQVGMDKEDLFIPRVTNPQFDPILNDPIAWVNDKLAMYTNMAS